MSIRYNEELDPNEGPGFGCFVTQAILFALLLLLIPVGLFGMLIERTLLLDTDLGLANVDVMLGLSPRFTLSDVIAGRPSKYRGTQGTSICKIFEGEIGQTGPSEKVLRQLGEKDVEKLYRRGLITHGERYQKIVDVWTQVGDQTADEVFRTLEALSPGRIDLGLGRAPGSRSCRRV